MERATSFGAVAEDYDRLRPSVAPDAVAWLVPAGARVAVDLGAGTGAMTRALLPRVASVVAVEPDRRMLAVLTRRTPAARAVSGRAAALPLRDASADLVVVASAWHWMAGPPTVAEVARVLRDGGRFAVVWTGRADTDGWQSDLVREIGLEAETQQAEQHARTLDLPPAAPFTAVERAEFPFAHRMSVDDVAATLGTFSAVIARGPEAVADVVRRAREALADRFGADAEVDVPLRTLAYRSHRLPRAR